jgi:phage host-nuclease inhibitor protein Gam
LYTRAGGCSRFTFLHVLLIYNLLDYQYLVKDELTTMGSRHSSSHGFGLIDVRERKPSFPQK